MALPEKAAIEADYTASLAALRAITQPQKDAAFAPFGAFVTQCTEALIKLQCRELVDGRVPNVVTQAATLNDIQNALARAKVGIDSFIASMPD